MPEPPPADSSVPRRAAVWLDGRLVEAERAVVSVLDHGFTVGDGVFETLAVERGRPFAASRHLARLARSAAGIGLEVPFSDDELRAAMDQVITSAPPGSVGRLRITLSSGPAPMGSGRSHGAGTVVVVGGPGEPRPATASVVTVRWPRNEDAATAGLKTISYADNVVALAAARAAGADEAIMANTAGQLCEGTGSNVFLALEGRLVTPALSVGCLAGVTRELVCELTAAEEVTLPVSALAEADEVLLTSSTRCAGRAPRRRHRAHRARSADAGAVSALAQLAARDLDP